MATLTTNQLERATILVRIDNREIEVRLKSRGAYHVNACDRPGKSNPNPEGCTCHQPILFEVIEGCRNHRWGEPHFDSFGDGDDVRICKVCGERSYG